MCSRTKIRFLKVRLFYSLFRLNLPSHDRYIRAYMKSTRQIMTAVIYRASQMSLYVHFSSSTILSESVYRILTILTYCHLVRFILEELRTTLIRSVHCKCVCKYEFLKRKWETIAVTSIVLYKKDCALVNKHHSFIKLFYDILAEKHVAQKCIRYPCIPDLIPRVL